MNLQNTTLSFIGILVFLGQNILSAQNLSFSQPVNFLPNARTDKAIDITNFKGAYFVTWKDAGANGNIHVCYLGKQYATHFSQNEATVQGEKSAFAPVLRVVNDRIYALWLAADGSLKYIISNSDTSFNTSSVNTVSFAGAPKLRSGITATVVKGRMMIASHAANKPDMVVALIDTDENGKLKPSLLQTVPKNKSDEYPFIVTLSDNRVRLCFKSTGDHEVYYADYDPDTKTCSNQVPVSKSKTKLSPAIYHAFNTTQLFYVWKGDKKDDHIYYASNGERSKSLNKNPLPEYFKTYYPVSICKVDERKFIMAYIGEDQKFYLSYFSNYNPARWMENILFPAKATLTLKDIVIPGSHDAGMSALNGIGGTQGNSSINPCNTLTQTQNIGKQLNAGIRMFDIRVGRFKNAIYTKHSASDCMAESIGGGYGERFKDIVDSVKAFLNRNRKEFIILTFSHFCPTEAPAAKVADSLFRALGAQYIYNNRGKSIDQVKLNDLAGKVLITFEGYANRDRLIDSNTMADHSANFLNFRRAYAATNQIDKLLKREEQFFTALKNGVNKTDLIRLDWQLTQNSQGAALVCNDFQNENVNPIVNGMMLLTNVVNKNQSITDMAIAGNKYLPAKLNEWIRTGIIINQNKPNIVYTDVAGGWLTDYCVELNSLPIYNK
jgi:hypothetical protein